MKRGSAPAFVVALMVWLGQAHAACSPVPYTFTPGTVIQSAQVNANFAALQACFSGSAAAPHVATNAALVATSPTATPAVWRDTYFASGVMPSGIPQAAPVYYVGQAATCASMGFTADNGFCVSASGGGSFIGFLGSTLDPREWGAYCDVAGKPQGGAKYNITVVNGATVIDVAGVTVPAQYVGGRIVVTDFPSPAAANNSSYNGAILGVASDGAGGTNVTVDTAWTYASLTAVQEGVWWGHDDAAAINAAIAYAKLASPDHPPTIYSAGGCGVYSAPVNLNTPADWKMDLTALGSANLPLATTAVLEINGPAGSHYVGSFSNDFGVEGALLPVNLLWDFTNGFTHWMHGRLYDWFGATLSATVTGASSTNQGVVTGSTGSCSGSGPYTCVLTVTAVTSGSCQLGNSLSGTSIPAATYIKAQTFPTTGGVGTYTIFNLTSNPGTIGSETINCIGFDVTVTGGNANQVGLVSRNNSPNINDRTMVVAFNAGTLTFNIAPPQAFSNVSLTLYQDANGVIINNPGGGTAGLHMDQSHVRVTVDYDGYPGDLYGCAIYVNGNYLGVNNVIGDGIAQLCLGPNSTSTNSIFGTFYTASITSGSLFNATSVISMDGAGNLFMDFSDALQSQLQFWNVTGSATGAFDFVSNQPRFIGPGSFNNFAPNVAYFFYTEKASTSTSQIEYSSFASNKTGATFGGIALVTGGSGSWGQYPAVAISRLETANSPLQCQNAVAPCMFPQGIDLNMNTLMSFGRPSCTIGSAYTLSPQDTGDDCVVNGAGGFNITIPNNLNAQVPNAGSTWEMHIVQTAGAADTIVPGAGATLYNAGASVGGGGVTLSLNTPYILWCPRNAGGTAAVCYLFKEPN